MKLTTKLKIPAIALLIAILCGSCVIQRRGPRHRPPHPPHHPHRPPHHHSLTVLAEGMPTTGDRLAITYMSYGEA